MPQLSLFETEIHALLIGASLLNILFVLIGVRALRRAAIAHEKINRETYGLLKKIEGLTARKQEQLTREYDDFLESMTNQVPIMVARAAGNEIFETEKQVLTRLAELEPDLKSDSASMQKMETIIKSMEGLEAVVIQATSKAVEQMLIEKRKGLFGAEESVKVAN